MNLKTKKATLQQLGSNLREARIARGLTQASVAKQAGLCVAYVSLIERGGRNPPATTVVQLARIVGCEPGVLFPKAA